MTKSHPLGLSHQAHVLSLAWSTKILLRKDVEAWANEWIEYEHLTTQQLMCLASLSSPVSKDSASILESLRSLILQPSQDVWPLLLGILSALYQAQCVDARGFADALYMLTLEPENTFEHSGTLSYYHYQFWNHDELLMTQTHQTLINELDQFAQQHASHVEWFSPSV